MNDEEAGALAGDGGVLYVIATPIGNLQDITLRALEVLRSADLIVAEDTRHSARLLDHFGIDGPLSSCHEHNEERVSPRIVARMEAGASVALISDAGTPLISDPGFRLVQAARARGLAVVPIPGPSAVTCALSVAGLPTERFCFEGFMPAKPGPRRRRLAALREETRTMVFFEAPHRIEAMLADIAAVLGEGRRVAVARELTKLHESVATGTASEVLGWLHERPERRRGEFVVLVGGLESEAPATARLEPEAVLRLLLEELPLKRAVAVTARLTGAGRNDLYARALAIKADED